MSDAQQISLMLVADHFIVRAGLAKSLSMGGAIKVVAQCSSGEEAIEEYRKHLPSIVIMDWRLPGISGVDATREIRKEFPRAPGHRTLRI
jgi:Response regulator containing a CheY-like receiver domain and an HTH DNA-binding domain